MSASPRWLAVRMCCVFVLDLMPNLLSNNDCTGSESEWQKKGKGKEKWALTPHRYSSAGSQQEPYVAAVWFWQFVNVVSETCHSPWFIMACCSLSGTGAYMKSVPAIGDRRYMCTLVIAVARCWNACLLFSNKRIRTQFTTLLAQRPESKSITSWACLKMKSSHWCSS